jgi:hypothetical protein
MGIKIQGDIETTVFFFKEDKNIFDENNHWFNLNKRSETNDGFVTYEYDVPRDYQFKIRSRVDESLSSIFKQKDDFDLLVEVYKKVDWSLSSIRGVNEILSFRIAQFKIVDFNSKRELYDWGNEKKISETESMVIRYGKVWEYNPDDFNKGDLSNLLLSIRREMKLNNLGL